MMTEAEYRRIMRLPDQIEGTLAKLERLLAKAEEVGLRSNEWADRWEALNSRFLTSPDLINEQWERAVRGEEE